MMFEGLPTPCYVVDEGRIRHNLEILQQLEKDTGCHVLLAQKAFSMYSLYPMIGRYISGTTASGLYEARSSILCFTKRIENVTIRLVSKLYRQGQKCSQTCSYSAMI